MHALELDSLGRAYGAVQALSDLNLTLRSGEVHALMGENGAGKSTLIRVLAGLERPDTGVLHLDGREIPPGSPAAMRSAGLRFIHQELHAVRGLSVAENMFLDHPCPTRFGLIDWRALNGEARAALARLRLDHIAPTRPMTSLGPGDQMLVRIASTLIGNGAAWLYVMDEPTAALTEAESAQLFAVIGDLKAQGAGILYVSHRMAEVLRLADRITVLRDGRLVSSGPMAGTDQARIVREMTGRDLHRLFPTRTNGAAGPEVLRVENLRAGPVRADLSLRAGEVLGIGGLAGSGRGALLCAILGALPRSAGQVTLEGTPLSGGPAQAWARGLAYVPRERRSEGLMIRRAIFETVTLPHLGALARARIFLDPKRQRDVTRDLGDKVRLKATSVNQPCEGLSGGNQQKVLFARALAGAPRVLLLDDPTRGVDIGARSDLYRLIRSFAEAGGAVILASSDLPELIGLSDRIAVMRDGILAETVPAAGLSEADLLARFYHFEGTEAT